ncbi:undecaprenyl-diphosphate phosphatase [Desulfogranum mediterraneum]|uniref:undecaprenyl-diphosphate phosphatase n=1 Tax=Desulfogranum mediterraneum TaxID=160661 RepID=UPI0003FCF77E|nr:undecaprenyl-diphosphate phosphatase [Desulfogranum mediterraneum]
MEFIKAIVLGIVQGLTEFLPISSSGHLVIGSELLNFHDPGISFEVFLHLGTLIAVVIAFHSDLQAMVAALFSSRRQRQADPELNRAFLWNCYIILATLPAVVVGLFLKDHIERIFDNILVTFTMLAFTGLIMVITTKLPRGKGGLSGSRAVLIGTAQAMAILPGLSRSGSTIFTGMALGVQRETAARFSFIMSIPAILGAAVLKLGDLLSSPLSQGQAWQLLVGTAASVISGYFAIIVLMQVVRRGRLHWFGYYCFCLSAAGFLWYFFRGA